MDLLKRAAVPVVALLLIGIGCWFLHPAVSLIVTGTLLWIDLFASAHTGRHVPEPRRKNTNRHRAGN